MIFLQDLDFQDRFSCLNDTGSVGFKDIGFTVFKGLVWLVFLDLDDLVFSGFLDVNHVSIIQQYECTTVCKATQAH